MKKAHIKGGLGINIEEAYEKIIVEMRKFFKNAGFFKAVLGLSGGIDSAVTACLAVDALGARNVTGVAMPSIYSGDDTVKLARDLADNLNIKFIVFNINIPFMAMSDTLGATLKGFNGVARENLQARLRMCYLMGVANSEDRLLLDTGNHTENWLGYDTLYGDLAGALAPIGDLTKTEVYEMADFLNKDKERIPQATIDRTPSAELADDQVDPFDYEIYSPLVREIAVKMTKDWSSCSYDEYQDWCNELLSDLKSRYPPEMVEDAVNRINRSVFKRNQAPPDIKLR